MQLDGKPRADKVPASVPDKPEETEKNRSRSYTRKSVKHNKKTIKDNQIIDSNYLVKHTIPAVVSVSIRYRGTVDDAQQTVVNSINGVFESTLEASDISDALYSAGATFVELPFTISVVYNDIDGTRVETSSQDSVVIPRVGRFLAEAANVTVTSLE